ncbi:MAG: hypothetical protein ACN4GG_09570 [Akkermansiaceae bacterium]
MSQDGQPSELPKIADLDQPDHREPLVKLPKPPAADFSEEAHHTERLALIPPVKALIAKISAKMKDIPISAQPVTQSTPTTTSAPTSSHPRPERDQPEGEDAFTPPAGIDSDHIAAIISLLESSLEQALHAPKTSLHTDLAPMLRSTVRRAVAEQIQTAHHFGSISITDRLIWRMKALFTSQSYDDIIFERTHRYQVEEVFLMRYDTFSLISYASRDPSRHSNPKKIRYDISRLIRELKGADGQLRDTFDLPRRRSALTRQGRNCFLVAVIRGRANALVCADLDYTLKQVEQCFEKQLHKEDHQLVHVLQPLLEDCLLIQSPAAPK